MKITIVSGLIALALTCGAPAHAFATSDLTASIQDQQTMLREGLLTGRLTLAEADIIAYNLNRIITRQARLLDGGAISGQDLQRIRALLDHNFAMIAKKRPYGVKKLF